jgi:general secretion pathway protein E
MPAEQRFLGEILVRRGVVPPERIDALFAVQREKGADLVDLLVGSQLADEIAVARALADEAMVPYADTVEHDKIPTALATRVPIAFAKSRKLIVLSEDEQQVNVACADPFDTAALDDVRLLLGKIVEPVVAPRDRILDAINRVYEREAGGGELEQSAGDEVVDEEVAGGDILDSDDEAPVIRWVNSLFLQAMKERASDIHIEPEEKEVLVRYRIDGELYVARRAPRAFMNSIISRIKIESSLNIAEKRLPQDGRITKKIAGKGFDIRVSTIPTSRGYERIVMRLLNKSSVLLDLTDLGFSPRDYLLMDGLIQRPDGIILVTGPTGSGKTTTLYACLNRINKPNVNILTAEDPVEYEIGGIHQVHVQAKIGLTFASALRAFLRQDPDVVMVGEIRDKETVEVAINASLTGHLVLSTIHTNDSAGAVTRLSDMGVEPFLIRSSLIGILAQRLVRVLCPHCKEAYPAEPFELEELGLTQERVRQRARRRAAASRYFPRGTPERDVLDLDPHVRPMFFRPKGCDRCSGTGFQGRRGIYELMLIDDVVGPLILKNADAQSIKRGAIEQGMDTLRDDGARKVLAGMTSVEEVLAATQEDVEAAGEPTSLRRGPERSTELRTGEFDAMPPSGRG